MLRLIVPCTQFGAKIIKDWPKQKSTDYFLILNSTHEYREDKQVVSNRHIAPSRDRFFQKSLIGGRWAPNLAP